MNEATPEPYNWLPLGCGQTCPCQHFLRNESETPHLRPLARPAAPLPLLPISPVTCQKRDSSVTAHWLPHSPQHLSYHSPIFILSSFTVPIPAQTTVAASEMSPYFSLNLFHPMRHSAASYFNINLIVFLPFLKTTNGPPLLSEQSLNSLIHSRRPYRIWSLPHLSSLISDHSPH